MIHAVRLHNKFFTRNKKPESSVTVYTFHTTISTAKWKQALACRRSSLTLLLTYRRRVTGDTGHTICHYSYPRHRTIPFLFVLKLPRNSRYYRNPDSPLSRQIQPAKSSIFSPPELAKTCAKSYNDEAPANSLRLFQWNLRGRLAKIPIIADNITTQSSGRRN